MEINIFPKYRYFVKNQKANICQKKYKYKWQFNWKSK